MDEIEVLARLLDLPAGYEVTLGRELTACRLDEGSFLVEYETQGRDGDPVLKEKAFSSAKAAAEFLVGQRRSRKLGADFEETDSDEA